MLSPERNGETSNIPTSLGLLVLRVSLGVALIAFHGWALVYTGWAHFWRGEAWIVIDGMNQAGLDYPKAMAIALSVILFMGSVFLILGLLGRLTPLALVAAMSGILYSAFQYDIPDYFEPGIAYLSGYLALTIMGPGSICADRLFQSGDVKRRRTNLQELELQ